MTFEILTRMNSRSCSYTKKSIVAVLEAFGLRYEQRGTVLYVSVPQEQVAQLEHALLLVDRCVSYRKKEQ